MQGLLRPVAALLVWVAAFSTAAGDPRAAPNLSPADRRTAERSLGRAGSDADLWSAMIEATTVELGQRLRPASVDRRWAIAPDPVDAEAALAAAVAQGRLAAYLAAAAPTDSQFERLRVLRARYAIYADRGWPAVPPGPTLEDGVSGSRVAALRRRLFAESYLSSADDAPFDRTLSDAVRRFQEDHALPPDGRVGPATRVALNVTAQARLDQIDANLERRRWTPRDLPPERLEVDTSGATARLYRGDAKVLEMRVIVGAPATPTPIFISQVESVVFNPPWNVPQAIAENELEPRERREPGYLQSHGFSRIQGRLVQRPGPGNALGLIKFDFASPFGVYLHDTSAPQLFAGDERHLSHGCVRLEKPRELAALLLGDARVERAIAGGETERDPLPRRLLLLVEHWTVTVEPDGRPTFRPDVYGWDRKLAKALGATAPRP